jgi:hypothetical protein
MQPINAHVYSVPLASTQHVFRKSISDVVNYFFTDTLPPFGGFYLRPPNRIEY